MKTTVVNKKLKKSRLFFSKIAEPITIGGIVQLQLEIFKFPDMQIKILALVLKNDIKKQSGVNL